MECTEEKRRLICDESEASIEEDYLEIEVVRLKKDMDLKQDRLELRKCSESSGPQSSITSNNIRDVQIAGARWQQLMIPSQVAVEEM